MTVAAFMLPKLKISLSWGVKRYLPQDSIVSWTCIVNLQNFTC